jgi:hypothetical protein
MIARSAGLPLALGVSQGTTFLHFASKVVREGCRYEALPIYSGFAHPDPREKLDANWKYLPKGLRQRGSAIEKYRDVEFL